MQHDPTQAQTMPDVQSERDPRKLPINHVGVKRLRYPIYFEDNHVTQPVVALCSAGVFLPAEQKGTHMSRLVTLFEEMSVASQQKPITVGGLSGYMEKLLKRLDAPGAKIEIAFDFFLRKKAPVSKIESTIDYQVRLIAEMSDGHYQETLSVDVPVTSLCPCSKRISDYGAHNQRSVVTITAAVKGQVSVASLIRIAEEEASSELFAILKRVDEKYVTEHAYDHPRFVEDLVRAMAKRLLQVPQLTSFTVEAENFESIHNHSAYARIQRSEVRDQGFGKK